MASKLTLRIDERLIERAKRQAQARGVSVSALVADYFAALNGDAGQADLPPIVRRLRGALRHADIDRAAQREHWVEKYLAKR